MSRLRSKIIKRIENISPEEWNKVFPNVPEGYYFLKTLDESKFEQYSFYYILVHEGNELVGAAPCFVTKRKRLTCGIPMGQGQIGISGKSPAVIEAIQTQMEKLAHRIHVPIIIFKDFDRSYDELLNPLLKNSFFKINSLPMTRLDLDFNNFEDYLKTLSGATRHDLRKKLKKASSVQIESSIVNALDENTLTEAYALYLQSLEMHSKTPFTPGVQAVPLDFFHLISSNMPQETKFFLYRINGKLASFVFCLISNDVLLDYFIGFDYTLAHEFHLYFFRFKEIMEWGLKNGIKIYEMGAMGYEPKRRLNFNLIPVYSYIKIRSKILRPFLTIYILLLKLLNLNQQLH